MASRTVWKPLLAFCAAGALLTGPAGAQESDASSLPDAARITFTTLTGTLAKARSTGSVALGYREDAIPFSFLNARKQPVGYSIELCRRWCRPSRTPSKEPSTSNGCRSPPTPASTRWSRAASTWSAGPPPAMSSGRSAWPFPRSSSWPAPR